MLASWGWLGCRGWGWAHQRVLSLHPMGVMGWDLVVQRNPEVRRRRGLWGGGLEWVGLEEKQEGDPEICVKSGPEKCVGVLGGGVSRSA